MTSICYVSIFIIICLDILFVKILCLTYIPLNGNTLTIICFIYLKIFLLSFTSLFPNPEKDKLMFDKFLEDKDLQVDQIKIYPIENISLTNSR